MSRKTYDTLERTLKRYLRQANMDISKVNKKALADLKLTLSNIYESYGQDTSELFNELQKYKRLPKFEKEVRETLRGVTVLSIPIIKRVLTDVFKATYETTFNDLLKGTELKGLQKNLKSLETVMQQNMGTVWTERLKNYSDKEVNEILTTIRQSVYEGKSYQNTAKELNKKLDQSLKDTMRVVRTESKRVQSECQMEVFDKFSNNGYEVYKVWNCVGDERTRDSHIEMDGQEVLHGEDFNFPDGSVGPAPAMSPSPSESINCRCYLSTNIVKKD